MNKTQDILQYRKQYYQENKERISAYQKGYYRRKKGLPSNFNLNWKGEKINGIVFLNKSVCLVFD
jgi:hypothetical protein